MPTIQGQNIILTTPETPVAIPCQLDPGSRRENLQTAIIITENPFPEAHTPIAEILNQVTSPISVESGDRTSSHSARNRSQSENPWIYPTNCTYALSCTSTVTMTALAFNHIIIPPLCLPLLAIRGICGPIGLGVIMNETNKSNNRRQEPKGNCCSCICLSSLLISALPELCLVGMAKMITSYQTRTIQIACSNDNQNNNESS